MNKKLPKLSGLTAIIAIIIGFMLFIALLLAIKRKGSIAMIYSIYQTKLFF